VARDRAQVRREEILAAAVGEFAARGIAGTRATDVAKALGVSSGLIFYHFESKDHLIAEAFVFVVERGLESLRRIVADPGPPMERMVRALRLYGPDEELTGWRVWVDGWSAALRNDALRDAIVRLNDAWEAAFLTVVQDGVDAGVFRPRDPGLAVSIIIATLDGTAVQAVIRGANERMRVRHHASLDAIADALRLRDDDRATLLALSDEEPGSAVREGGRAARRPGGTLSS